jgi:diguanylate cyclase (GGDEF)-like protein
MKNNYLKSLFTQEISYETDIPMIRKQILLSKLLLITLAIFSLLAVYHFFLSQELSIVIIDTTALGAFVLAFISLRKYNDFNSAVSISALTLFIFTLLFIVMDKNSNYGLIWSIFFPLFIMLTMGHKKGFFLIVIYYLVVFYLAYSGVGSWQNGKWNMASFFHFAIASTILVYTIYSVETSQEEVHKELKQLHDNELEYMGELERLTITDPLTSLYNRRHLDKVYKREFHHAKRHKHIIAFYILDIDFFKQYNDTYGHKAGDDVLVKIAEVMKTYFKRHEDLVFRLGGEEFGGLITGQKADEVENFIAQLCIEITSMNIEHTGNKNQPILTVSIGMKILDDFENDNFDNVYKDADLALYNAKENGRNKAVNYLNI